MHEFPVLCWQLSAEVLVAHLIGFEREFVGKDFRTIKENIKNWIVQEVDTYYDYDAIINNAQLRQTSLKINASYRTASGYFPVIEPIRIPIVAVFGDNEEYGYSKCYLPFMKKSFYYYDDKQLKGLIEHFVRETLDGKEPYELHRFLYSGELWLDQVRVSIASKAKKSSSIYNSGIFDSIKQYAERLPLRKSSLQAANLFPQTAWERGDIVNRISQKLLAQSNSLLLIGDPGCGKSVVLHEAVRRASKQADESGQGSVQTFWRTNAQRLIANAKYLGEWQEQCDELINYLEIVNGVLWVSDLINLLTLGGEAKEDSLAAYILPKVRTNSLRLIGEFNQQEFYAALQVFPEFIGYFQVIQVDNLSEVQVQRISQRLQNYASENLAIKLSESALKQSQRLLHRFLSTQSLPGKLVRFLSRCIREARQHGINEVDDRQVLATFVRQTGMPEVMIRDDLLLSFDEIFDYFNRSVLHQTQATKILAESVLVFKTGLNDPNKPIATLLFAGPTGVGKTAAAKALASYFFGVGQLKDPLFQIDMSEFQHPAQISRLIGDDNTPGKLTEHVRERPFSVILFDEIEKAHPAILDVLLGLFDEGLLVDRFGRLTDFRNCIFIMTSNLGVNQSNAIGFVAEQNQLDISKITAFFRPEFINRIDRIVTFNSLGESAIKAIAKKELASLQKREGLRTRKISLEFSEAVLSMLVSKGFHPRYGARPMQRAIETILVGQISAWLLTNAQANSCTLMIDINDKQVLIKLKQ